MTLPLAVELEGRRVLVVGAGTVGTRKIRTLLDHGAAVTVVDPAPAEAIATLEDARRLVALRRPYEPADLDGVLLAVAATDDADTNARVAADADLRGVLCVRGDGGGSASFLAGLKRGDLLIAVSTGGRAPALAARVRAELEEAYGPEYAALVDLLGQLRADPRLAALDGDGRAAVWRRILDTDILHHLRNNNLDLAREVASACLSSSSG